MEMIFIAAVKASNKLFSDFPQVSSDVISRAISTAKLKMNMFGSQEEEERH
jgi:hypothetical protein